MEDRCERERGPRPRAPRAAAPPPGKVAAVLLHAKYAR